jgi:rhodanese-related sulfurtransferase
MDAVVRYRRRALPGAGVVLRARGAVAVLVLSAGLVAPCAAEPVTGALSAAGGRPASAVDLKSLLSPPAPGRGGAFDPTCATPPSGTGPAPNVSFKPRSPDRACLVGVAEAEKIRLKLNSQFVDVRSPAEYERARIADSINIPLHLVKTKPFLRTVNVVLVDHGRGSAELAQYCLQLKEAGFRSVAVLDGGLYAWQQAGKPLAGDPQAQARLDRMSAAELFAERLYTGWLVVDATTKGIPADLRKWLPGNIAPARHKAASEQAAAIRSLVARQRQANPRLNVLVVADADARYERLEAALSKGRPGPLLYLDGGLTAYRAYVERQVAMWAQQHQPPRFPSCRG